MQEKAVPTKYQSSESVKTYLIDLLLPKIDCRWNLQQVEKNSAYSIRISIF